MLLRECIAADVCKYFNEVDISRSLCVCKTLNWLIKKHVRVVNDTYNDKYVEFTGLTKAYFDNKKHVIIAFPPNIVDLELGILNLIFTPWPKTLTSLTICDCNDDLSDNLLDLICPALTKLDIVELTYSNYIATFTNIQDLSITVSSDDVELPPNLVKLELFANYTCMDLWRTLPTSLTDLSIVCVLEDALMKDLPKSLKCLKLAIYNTSDNSYMMRDDDYFNVGIEAIHLGINIYDDNVKFLSRLPKTVTSVSIQVEAETTDTHEIVALLPRTLLKLEMTSYTITDEFYSNLPPTLTSLMIDNPIGRVDVYPSLLPRTLTKLQHLHGDYLYVENNDVDFPPNIRSMSVVFDKNTTIDLSKLVHLCKLITKGNVRILPPKSLRKFEGVVGNIEFHDGLVACRDIARVTSVSAINNLPKSVEHLYINTLSNHTKVIYHPNLKSLSTKYALEIEQLDMLPLSLTACTCKLAKLIRTIDGRVWKIGLEYIENGVVIQKPKWK